jgi:hypothetical protein
VIYLLSVIREMRIKYSQGRNRKIKGIHGEEAKQEFCEVEHRILNEYLKTKILRYLHRFKEDHPSHRVLRKMAFTNFIELPVFIKKKLVYSQRISAQLNNRKMK